MSKQAENEYVVYVVELMQTMGAVSARRMFGGHGFFLEGLMFALMADNTLYLKTDEEFNHEFIRRGLAAFTYQRKGKDFSMSYYQAPEEALESAEQMNSWANKAYEAALRAAAKKQKK